ncbi:MAG: hypothetical protein VB070_04360 [Clostridiaceae bacterium]|nr:hypothetical protein [Clostridiaceae bacterium]
MKMHYKMIIVFMIVLCLSGCTEKPTTVQTTESISTPSSQSTANPTEATTQATESTQKEIELKLDISHNRMLLVPASLDHFNEGSKSKKPLFWELSEQQMQWNEVSYSIKKISSISGRYWYDSEEISYDVYQVIIGDWTNYCLIQESQILPVDQQILLDFMINGQEFVPKSKDFWIMQVGDDLYSIDIQENIQKISQRQVGGFDYETIEKKGIGDLFSWEWIGQWACSQDDNKILYLTSREQSFYSIWCIDIDKKTESRYCQDVAVQINGIGNQQLVAILGQEKTGDPFGKLISTTDVSQFEVINDNEWSTKNGWLYRQDGNQITMQNQRKKIEIAINKKDVFYPIQLSSDMIWLVYNRDNNQNMDILYVDLKTQVCSTGHISGIKTITDYQKLLTDMKSGEMTFLQAADKGVMIKIDG